MVGILLTKDGELPKLFQKGLAISSCTALESRLKVPQFIDITFTGNKDTWEIAVAGQATPLLPIEIESSDFIVKSETTFLLEFDVVK